ncbi:uncharacterized protein [Diadema antillarum]|uniref:uncharacterized protein n=1 Tax=Diadema antillarum TaxID=105358 RepID=UPI003A87F759
MKAVFVLLVGLLLASAVVGGPIFGSRQLGEEVEECSELTRFKEGFVYNFTYEALTESGIKGAGPGSMMKMTCDVLVLAPERCRNVLKTVNCRLYEDVLGRQIQPEFGSEMSAFDLVFRTKNGRIVEVLAHPDEPVHILNVKRAILTYLQLDMKADDVDRITIDEVTVHGNCSNEMTVTFRDNKERPRRVEVVTDLNSCELRRRSENMTRWQSFTDVIFNTTVVDKFINSSKMCTYELKGTSGEIKSIKCSEIHSFWPLNFNSESGVRTSVQTSLFAQLPEKLNSLWVDPANTRSTCLRYEYNAKEVGEKPDDVTADQAIDILKALVKSSREEVRMETPRLFGRWRAALQGMNNDTIHEVFDRAYDCSAYSQTCRNNPDKAKLAREYLLDGLLPCTTLPCFSVKNYAIARGIVPKPLANAWMVTMALQNYPTLELMSEMLRMAQMVPSQITIFPLSIMVHNYWVNNEDIHTSNMLPEPMMKTISYLKSLIRTDCSVPVEDERLAMIALKAIGNIGEPVERFDQITFAYADKVSPALISCAKNKDIPVDISKAAIPSMRRFVLGDQLRRQVIEELFKETSLPVPHRIAAYLLAMKANPSVSELTGIWNFLKTEPVRQMQAFCFSHIENVLESSEPTLQEMKINLREAMGDDELPAYPKDFRKFSRYFELSKNLTEPWRNNTVGVQFESDLIYKPESYLPQEVMFHYVLNAFGKSWDLFETGFEMKGFEPILESVFGPEGIFPEISLQNLFENLDMNILAKVRDFAEAELGNWIVTEPEVETFNSKMFNKKNKYAKKSKREAMDNQRLVDIIHETTMRKLNELHETVGMETSATDATVFLRLLGNEFGFVSASDVLSVIPYTMGIFEEFVNKTKQIPQLLSNGLNLNTTRSFVFMDKSFILPTGIGMPLNCSINGTTVVSLRVRSQFSINLPKIIAAGYIAPSGAVEVLATMGIDLPTKVFTGVMANSTICHSSKVAGNVTIDGTHLQINLNNTEQPMNLFNYSTTYNLLRANGNVDYIPGVLQDAVRSQRCTNVSNIFGVDLCMSWAYPNASYVPEAPRFPFAGPNSFNVTLVNTDKALKAFTFDALYKQIKEGGAPASIPFTSIGRKGPRKTAPITKLIDTVRISFYAPGEELTRNVTSFLSIDRLRKTAQWTFTVPEVKNFTMFAGILNETTDAAPAYRAVFNVSAAENAASVDFLVRNETTVAQKNLTAVFNASINNLYWAAVGQFIRQSASGNWNAHLTETFYWDNETPLYRQILFPWTGYQINHEKYQTSSISFMRRANGPVVDRNMQISALNWAFDFNTRQTVTDALKELTFQTRIANATWEFPLMDASLRNVTTDSGYNLEAEIGRNTHHVFAKYYVTKEQRVTRRNFRTGLRTDVFVDNPDMAMFMNSPYLLKLFGETALIDQPVEVAGGVNFTITDESADARRHLIEATVYIPNPRRPSSDLTYNFNLRTENASLLRRKDYSLELSTPIPFLKMTNINLLHLMLDCETGTSLVEHMYTLQDTRYNKPQVTVSNTFNAGWKKPTASWYMSVDTPRLTFYQNYTALYSRENGIQYFYETSQDSMSDLLDFTEISNFSIKPTAVSTYWSYIHKLVSSNISNSLVLGGPITEMRPRLVPMIVRDIMNKTVRREFSAVKDIVLNKFVYNVTGSSLTLRQNVNVTSPFIANMSASHYFFLSRELFDHKLSFAASQRRLNISSGLNYSMVMADSDMTMKTEGNLFVCRYLQMKTLTSVNATLLKITSPFDLEAFHSSEISSPFLQLSIMSTANGNIGDSEKLNVVANHNTTVSSRVGSMAVIGNFNIDGMKSPVYFDTVSGNLNYNLLSRYMKSSFNSSVSFNTFRKLFKFQRVQAEVSHGITSKLINWNANGQTLLQHFSTLTQFGEISTSLDANLLSKLVNSSHSSAFALRNMEGLVQFDELSGHLRNNVTSKFVNSTYETEVNFNNVRSLFAFRKLGGSSNYVMSSRLLNVTANNTLTLNGFNRVFEFDSIIGNQIWFVKTPVMNATMDNAVTLNGFRRLFDFDGVSGRISANMTSPVAQAVTFNTLLIERVESIFTVAKIAIDSNSNFTSRPVNVSLTQSFAVNNHRSWLNFDSISANSNFTSKVFNVSSSALNEISFGGVRSLFNFDAIRHFVTFATNSYYVNTTVSERISLENFRRMTQFDLAAAEIFSSFMTRPLNVTYQQVHRVEGMNGLFQYPLAETEISGNITSRWLNASTSYIGRLVGMRAPFAYDSSIAKVQYYLQSIINVTGVHGFEVTAMRKMFDFDRISGESSHVVDTPLSHMAVGGLLEFDNFRSIFNFDLVNVTTSNIFSVTPLTTTFASYNAGLTLRGFEKINRFTYIRGFAKSAILTKWTNWTMGMDADFSGFTSFMVFDHITLAGRNEIRSPLFVTLFNTTNNVIGSTGFLTASAANSRNLFSISSRIAKIDTGAIWEVNDLTGLLSFRTNNIDLFFNTSSPLHNTGSAFSVEMNNWRNITQFGKFEVNAGNDVFTRLARWNVHSHFRLEDMTDVFTYSRVESTTSSNFTSIVSSLNTSLHAHIVGQSGILTYDEMVVSTVANFSSWPFKVRGASMLNIQNMAGFMRYDSISSSASTNVTSRIFNTTSQMNFQANEGTGLFKVQRANITGSLSLETPLSREIKATTTSQVINSRKLFNFDEVTMRNEFSFLTCKINVTANSESSLTNFVNLTNFESSESSAEMTVASKYFNSSSSGVVQLRGFQRLFTFERVSANALTSVQSILVNATSTAGVDFSNFERMFTFARVNSSADVQLTSRFATANGMTGMELVNFRGPTTFERLNGSFLTSFNSTMLNSTTAGGYSLENFNSLFNFVRVGASVETVLTNRLMNATAIAEYSLTDSSCFCRFARLFTRSAGSFTTRFASGSAISAFELNNVRNLTSFDLFNITTGARLISKPISAVYEYEYSVKNQQWLYKFDQQTSRLHGDVKSKWLNITSMLETQMNNSNSLFGFDAAKTQGSYLLRTPVGMVHVHGYVNLDGFTNITHFVETSGLMSANVTSPLFETSGYSRFYVSKAAGILTFKKALTDSFGNFRSRYVNGTYQNSLALSGFRGMKFSEISNRFTFYWADPINQIALKNGLDMTALQDMVQLFNITWVNPKGTVFVSQRLDYENLIASVRVPSIGVISAGASLNTYGDILSFYIDHQLMRDNLKTVNDITWFLRLNQSNVIYSNFSWNPETVSEIVDITVGAINSTFNRTITIANGTINRIMEVANRTLTHTRKMTNCTKCFMRYTYMVANETLRAALTQFNQTFYSQYVELNQTIRAQLMKLNETFYNRLEMLNQTITFARNNPRDFINRYVNLSRVNETVVRLNVTLRELYAKLRYNITHPRETFDNIKVLIKYDQRRDQITWLIENRGVVKSKVISYLNDVKANLTTKAMTLITDIKELVKYDAKVAALQQYIGTRFNVPKMQEKIEELKLKIEEIKQKMVDLRSNLGERINTLKRQIAALDKEMVTTELKVRMQKIKDFIVYYLNSTTLNVIESSIFIDYKDDAQVQNLMRKVIRLRPRNVIDVVDKDRVLEVKDNIVEGLRAINQTAFRYVNRTYVNETAENTLQMLREWNATFHEFVYVDIIKGDVKLVLNITREKVVNITKALLNFTKSKVQVIKAYLTEKWDARPRSIEELRMRMTEMMMELKQVVSDYLLERYNVDVDLISEKMLEEYLKRKEQIDVIIAKVIEISKNETHPINMLPVCYFDKTIYQLVQPPVNMTMNLTLTYSKMAFNLTKVYGKEAINMTKVYSRIAMDKGIALSKKYVPMVKKAMKEYKTALIEKSKVLKQKAIVYYNMAKGNATIFYEKYAPIVNETIRNYTRFAKQAVMNYTIVVRNMTDRYINMTIELLEPHVQPYRVIVMEKVDLLKARVASMQERIRNLPAETEQFLMDTAEYHIDRYPEYKQKTLQKIEEARLKLQELRVNLTNLYQEVKANLTRLYLEVKANVTEAYTRYSQKAQEMYLLSTEKLYNYTVKAQRKWQTVRPIMMSKSMELYDATKLRVNQTLDRAILMTKDEFSLINELPMRALDKTLFELVVDLRALINQLIETADLTIRDRESLLNYYPVKYLDMTVFEAGNFTYGKIVVAKNLTKFYANKTIVWANNTLVAANKTVFDVLILTNKTVREVIIPYVNQTTRDLVVFLNRTRSQPWRVTLNETLSFLNETSVVLMNRANETLIMVQTRALEAWRNITSEESIAKMKMYLNKTRDLIVTYARVANETIFILRNKSVNLVIYIRDETPLLNLTKEYALLARNITRDSIFRARNFSHVTMDFARNMTTSVITFINGTARDFSMEYVTYINNTMPGWMIRYYEVDQIPSRVRMRLAALEPVQLARNLTAYAINRTLFMTEVALNRSQALTRYAVNQTRVMTQFALNRTRVLTKEAINRTRTLIRDTLNTIGRLDDHSFAMNISHPFNWTSFRTVPRLSNRQIQYIKDKMALINQNVVVPVQLKIEELRNNLTVRYDEISAMVREYYELKKPIVEGKIREYREKIEEKIEEYKNILNDYKRELEEKWMNEWKPILLQKKDEIISKWEAEIKPTFDALVANVTRIVRDPELLSNLKRNYTYFRNEYLPELRRYIMEEKYPEMRRYIVEEKYPEIKEEVLARYEVAKELFEEFRYNATVFIDDMQLRFEKLRVQAEEKWTELLDRITGLKQNWPETVRKLKEDIEDVKVQLKAKFTKLVNKILSILKELRIPVEVLPLEHISLYNPWKYTAMIFGDNHVMTFDGKVYSVPPYYDEQQTYILAHDFVDRNFSLLVQKKRVTLLVRNMSVAIDDQMVVYKNGEETLQELPYQTPVSKELTIMRSGPWVNVTSSSGIALLCHKEHFLCIFHLSGWYHSKSRGLLGNVDTEYHNEFVLPTGEVTTDLVEFVRAYDVSPASNPRNVVPSLFGSCAANFEMCRTLFLDDNSVLSETFNVINRTEFYNFCLEDTRKCHQTCDTANAAITLGKECSTNVSYTPECLSCNVGEITQENGRSVKSADIIFVVSETYAMAEDNSIQDNLKVLVNRIKGKLGAFNVSDVKYGITAFGGADIHGKPHTHTVCGHLQDNLVECLNSGIDSLVFQGARPIDAMQAVEYAAHYPFRKDAAKIIILITDEELMEESGKPWDFLFNINTSLPAIQQLLDRQGITFNVFSSYPTLNKKTIDSPILGVNYLGKQVIKKKSSGEEGVDRLAIPKGQYAKLATATRGSIMGLHWLQSGHRDLTYMFPRLIWKQVEPQFSGRVDYICRCTLGVYGEAREECRITRFVDGVF